MNRKYLKYVCKKNFILFIVLIALGTLSFGISLLNVELLYPISNSDGSALTFYSGHNYTGSDLIYIFAVFAIATLFISFKSISFRYKKTSADCFYHLPFNRKNLRRFNNIFNIAFILAAFTISYWIVIAAFGIKYSLTQPMEKNGFLFAKYYYDFTYYLVAYLLILLILTFMYIYNSFFIQLGNSALSSSIFFLFGSIFVSSLPYAIYNVASKFCEFQFAPYTQSIFRLVDAFYLPFYLFSLTDATIGSLIVGYKPHSFYMDDNLFPTILNCLFLLITIGIAIYYCFFVDDPSGEYNGIPGGRNKYIGMLIVAPMIATALEQITFSTYLIYGIIYFLINLPVDVMGMYLAYVVLNKSFKIRKIEWLYIGIAAALLCIGYGLSYIPGYRAPISYINTLF